jgi:hypothetical protein
MEAKAGVLEVNSGGFEKSGLLGERNLPTELGRIETDFLENQAGALSPCLQELGDLPGPRRVCLANWCHGFPTDEPTCRTAFAAINGRALTTQAAPAGLAAVINQLAVVINQACWPKPIGPK